VTAVSSAAGSAPRGHDVAEAVARVRAGGLVAYPTETLWGLGADARSASALDRLRLWKRRSDQHPISILVEGFASLAALGVEADARVGALAAAFWPGPLTLVLTCRGAFAPGVARADGAIGVRCSPHPVAAELAAAVAEAALGPLTATSLNRHAEPPARTRAEAELVCAADVDAPLVVGVSEAGGQPPSTVLDLTAGRPRVLRWGALDAAALERVLGREERLA